MKYGDTRSHKRLLVWQKAIELAKETYRLTSFLPKEERFGLTQQMRRAAVSVASNIAEGAGRYSGADKLNFFYMAQGSLNELDTQVEVLRGLDYRPDDSLDDFQGRLEDTGRLLSGLIQSRRKILVTPRPSPLAPR